MPVDPTREFAIVGEAECAEGVTQIADVVADLRASDPARFEGVLPGFSYEDCRRNCLLNPDCDSYFVYKSTGNINAETHCLLYAGLATSVITRSTLGTTEGYCYARTHR